MVNKAGGAVREKIREVYEVLRRSGKFAPLVFVTTFLPPIGSLLMLGVIYQVSPWLRANPAAGAPLFVFSVTFLCGLSIMPTNILGMVSGWSFGFETGLPVMMSAICAASLFSYVLNRRFVGKRFLEALDEKPKARILYNALVGQSFGRTTLIIFLLRLSPAMPFAATNLLMSSARVPIKSFLLGTVGGMLPRTAAVVLVGAGLSELDFTTSDDWYLLAFGIAATIVSIAVITYFSRQALARLTAEENVS